MSKTIVQYFEELKVDKENDSEFMKILSESFSEGEAGDKTAEKVLAKIKERYDEAKKNNA